MFETLAPGQHGSGIVESDGTMFTGEGWRVHVSSPAPGVLLTRAEGHLSVDAVQCLMDAFDEVRSLHHPVVSFHDWYGVSSYDSEARARYTTWARTHRSVVEAVHILVVSRLVVITLTVANLALGGYMKLYSRREPWQGALHALVARNRANNA